MGRGSSGGGGELGGGGGMVDILNTEDMISSRNPNNQKEVDEVLTVGKNMVDKYGKAGVLEGTYQIATLGGADANETVAYYDGSNVAMNANFMNSKKVDKVYDDATKTGYHPSRGNKSGAQAVASHEYGHALADAYARKNGQKDLHEASKDIVKQACKNTTGSRMNTKSFARAISGYATDSYAECVAEAVADVYCNGNKAHKNSKAIVNVIDASLLGKKTK